MCWPPLHPAQHQTHKACRWSTCMYVCLGGCGLLHQENKLHSLYPMCEWTFNTRKMSYLPHLIALQRQFERGNKSKLGSSPVPNGESVNGAT
eukprot:scaffold180930_cov19-Tisochrysis_lutea.AAC.1